MKLKKVILELEQNIKPYLPFLTDWMLHEHCSLNDEDFSLINFQINNNFKFKPLQYFNSSNKVKTIQEIVAKLIWDYQKFKDWIITNFVFRLLKIARENYYNDLFLHLPLEYISLPFKLKEKFRSFSVKTFNEFFEIYNEKDLYDEINFKKILEIEALLKNN